MAKPGTLCQTDGRSSVGVAYFFDLPTLGSWVSLPDASSIFV